MNDLEFKKMLENASYKVPEAPRDEYQQILSRLQKQETSFWYLLKPSVPVIALLFFVVFCLRPIDKREHEGAGETVYSFYSENVSLSTDSFLLK